ncbi:hypothetical protein [Spiroplasma endosymbiont of Polydrusus pterygomalis]|uniref:hypothetical protein n=1 Tax=Spiroplasma endosymbiont of Polydrusus pterygomalis TaxID=3139327 RepID=UPI003CCB0369
MLKLLTSINFKKGRVKMKLKRFIKSLVNNFLFIINAILWIFNINSIGELITGINVNANHKEKLIYGFASLLQYISYLSIIGLIITIYWWTKNDLSIAERISKIK